MPAAAAVLSGCSSFRLSEPGNGAIIRRPSNTTVVVWAAPSMSGLTVKVDGADVSNQINYVSDQQSQGDLSLPLGRHSITAEADVSCWYCDHRTYHYSETHAICVGEQSIGADTKVAVAADTGLSWAETSDATIGVAPDNGMPAFRWNFIPLTPGIGNSAALIQSAENSCLCMRSIDDHQNTPIGLAICDQDDPTQRWTVLQVAPGVFLIQNQGRGISDACLTEGRDNVLVQRANQGASNQHWKFKDNTGQFVSSPF
jgi:hypothetical protein